MTEEPNDTEWLRPALIACPSCGAQLFRVDRSPYYYDDWLLYCDRCPRRAEVSSYDPTVMTISAESPGHARFREIEGRLRPCSCGGRYLFDAPRRCLSCSAIVLDGQESVDLWPAIYSIPEGREPTQEEERAVAEFEAAHIRRDNLW